MDCHVYTRDSSGGTQKEAWLPHQKLVILYTLYTLYTLYSDPDHLWPLVVSFRSFSVNLPPVSSDHVFQTQHCTGYKAAGPVALFFPRHEERRHSQRSARQNVKIFALPKVWAATTAMGTWCLRLDLKWKTTSKSLDICNDSKPPGLCPASSSKDKFCLSMAYVKGRYWDLLIRPAFWGPLWSCLWLVTIKETV